MRKCGAFPVLVFFALVFCDYASAWFQAIAEESPVTVAVGDTAVLRCHTSSPKELTEVRLIRIQDGRYSIINIFEHGQDQQKCDLSEYVGRTEAIRDGLTEGRAAMKVFNVSVTDEGTYRCFLKTADYFDFVNLELRVTALGSHPRIDIEGFQDGGIKAVCRSAGWYPEPMLVNKDDDGEMKIQKEENGFYSIEYSCIITENSNRTFSCLLRTLFPKQEWEISVYVADGLFRKSTDVTTIVLALALVCSLAAAVMYGILYTCRRNEQVYLSAVYLDKIKSITIKKVNPKEEEPIGCESSPLTQTLLPPGPDSEAEDLLAIPLSVTIKEVSPKEEEPIGCESSPVTQTLLPPDPDSAAEDLDTIPSSITIKEVSPKEEEPIGCESSPVKQALPPPGPDSEDNSSAANTENQQLKVSLELVSSI